MKESNLEKAIIDTDPRIQKMLNSCFDRMDEDTLKEVLGGYEHDFKKLYNDLTKECYTLLYNGRRAEGETVYDALTNVNDSIEETFRVLDIAYFINAVFGKEVLMNWHHLEWSRLANTKKFISILASRDHGKSKSAETQVVTVNGVKKIKDVEVGDEIVTVNDKTYQQEVLPLTHKTNKYAKVLYKLKTKSGRECKLSSEHPLLTIDGWNTIDKGLSVGIMVALPREVLPYKGVNTDADLAKLLGFIVAEGYCGKSCVVSNTDWDILNELQAIGKRRGYKKIVQRIESRKPHIKNLTITEIYKDVPELKGRSSYTHEVPEYVLQGNREVVIAFISYYFEGDGGLSTWNSIECASMSRILLKQVQMLLQMLGINANLRPKTCKNGRKADKSYRLILYADAVLEFEKQIGFVSERKKERLKEVCAEINSTKRNTQKDFIPRFGIFHDLHIKDQANFSRKSAKKYCETKKRSLTSGGVKGDRLRINQEIVNSSDFKKLEKLTDSNIFWDEIESIEEIGEQWCYDIQVGDGTNNYIADGFYSHNSFFWTELFSCWKMYGYDSNQPNTQMNKKGFFFSNNDDKSKYFLGLIKERIMFNEVLRDRLYLNVRDFSASKLRAKNGASLDCKGFLGSARGYHPDWIVVDDPLTDQAIYSASYREKTIDYFYSVIMNMLVPNGQICMIGCVHGSTVILDKEKGFVTMESLNPTSDNDTKRIHDIDSLVKDNKGWVKATKYFVNGKVKTNKITTTRAYELECSERHPIKVMGNDGIVEWRKSSELKIGDYIAVSTKEEISWGKDFSLVNFKRRRRHHNLVRIDTPNKVTKDLAYIIGLYIAEGNIWKNGKGLELSTGDKEIEDWLLSRPIGIRFHKNKHAFQASNRDAVRLFEYLGYKNTTCEHKEISNVCMGLKKELMTQLLKGLFDGDGSITSSEKGVMVALSTSSVTLAKQVRVILQTGYGINCGLITANREKGLTEYTVSINGGEAIKYLDRVGFRLRRKQYKKIVMIPESMDYIPNQYELLKKYRATRKGTIIKKTASWIHTSFSSAFNKKIVSKKKIIKFLEYYRNKGCDEEVRKKIENNVYSDISWVKIKSIEKGESNTYDFVIPETNSFVTNGIISHNTPFHAQDIYSTFREPQKLLSWTYREYPAIFPDGQVLWADRYSFEQLKTKRLNLGGQIFGREFLLKPVTSDTSLFPWKMINPSIAGMDKFSLVNNVEAFPVGFERVIMSGDFAKSANVGSDATWFGIWGIDAQDKMWLIHSWRKVGATFNEQISKIKQLYQDFRFDLCVLEANNFQKIYVEYLEDTGIPIVPHVTTSNKTKVEDGVPSMAVMFERLQYRFPYGDEHSRNVADLLLSEFSSMSYTDKGIQGVGAHDDGVMMTWFATKGKNYQGGGFSFDFM